MRVLSATEAISPAIERTKAMLLPFRLKLWLKLGIIAILAEAGFQFSSPIGNPGIGSHGTGSGIGGIAGGLTALFIVLAIIGAFIALAVGLALFYLGSRLQLVLMDLVATRTTVVTPAWHRTGPRTWRWIGLKILFFLVILLCMGILLIYPIIVFFRSFRSGSNLQPGAAFFGTFFLFLAMVLFLIFVIVLATWLLRDFILPFVLFEDASISAAFTRAMELIRREPGPVLFYLLMKFLLSLAAGIAAEICIFLAALVGAIPLGLIAGLVWLAMHQTSATLIMYVVFGLLALVFIAWIVPAAICISAPVMIFYQAYALYFLGGRIPALGNLLEPPPPPMPYAVPPPETQPPLAPA